MKMEKPKLVGRKGRDPYEGLTFLHPYNMKVIMSTDKPQPPENQVGFMGRYYSESEFKAYKASSKYKWDMFWRRVQFWGIIISLGLSMFSIMFIKYLTI